MIKNEIWEGISKMNGNKVSLSFLDAAYKCKPADLEILLKKIESQIKNSDYMDNVLFRAKIIVTSKLALHNKY
jgi:hypothetical protein